MQHTYMHTCMRVPSPALDDCGLDIVHHRDLAPGVEMSCEEDVFLGLSVAV